MDPIMVAAVSGLASGVVCYFIGGALFTATWRLIARNQSRELEQVCVCVCGSALSWCSCNDTDLPVAPCPYSWP